LKVHQRKDIAREWLKTYFLENPCVDCGIVDIRVLEFDHIAEDKHANVGDLLAHGYTLETIKKEVAKCEVVCCNCHRIRTMTRRGDTWRILKGEDSLVHAI
jgi:L-lysine 2,3-aminomutase